MAPSLRSKPNTHARIQRHSTKFNELDVTPNRPEEKFQHPTADKDDVSRSMQSHADVSLDDPNSAPILGKDEQPAKPFSWSDGSSITSGKRSSPFDPEELSDDDIWDFEDSLIPFSSPTSEKNQLPDTVPLVSAERNDQSFVPMKAVDVSETASTVHRSSSVVVNEAEDIWNFDDSLSDGPVPEASKEMPTLSSGHLPAEELYDLTPKKATVPTQTDAKPNGSQPVVNDEAKSGLSQPTLQPKEKKQRPKAKKPIRFDSLTQEILEESATKKKKKKRPAPPVRLPIVTALQESAKASSSPVAGSQKPKPKRARPQKKKKPEIPPAPKNPPKPRGEEAITFLDSPAQPVAESSSESLPELANIGKRDTSKTILSVSSDDDFTATQQPQQQQHPRVPAIGKRGNFPDKSGAISAEQHRAKRRRLSRQFSVSEKGSPVVVNDAILPENIQPLPVKPHPPMSGGPELPTAAQSSSFLRSTSSGKHVEEQHGNAFDNINGKSSTQWLRRVSDKAPVPKCKPSIGRKLHDVLMKSFLGQTGVEEEPREPEVKSVSATSPNRVETQIRQAVAQLIAQLDDKKKDIFNVVDTYRKSGQDSVRHLKQQCLQDSGILVETLRSDGGLFGQKLRSTTDAIQAHGLARAKSALELDSAVQSRHQAYDRTRQRFRALRDELIREKNVAV